VNLLSLIAFIAVNISMLLSYFWGKGRFYHFPFWAGVIALVWFLPQAIGGFLNSGIFPSGSYAAGMVFATLCTIALWGGYSVAYRKAPCATSWLAKPFDRTRLFYVGALLCGIGFFFHWKLVSLPKEMLAETQWTGATVKYLFLSSIFKFGFLALWLLYLSQRKYFVPRLLVFIIPSLALLLISILLHGRRAEMMNLFSYMVVSLWLVRRVTVPRWLLVSLLAFALVLINAIGIYRAIIMNEEKTFSERVSQAARADYLAESETVIKKSGLEFKNYIFFRQAYADLGRYNFGLTHWNGLVFNYVPAQLVGRGVKNALMVPLEDNLKDYTQLEYGHDQAIGTTSTGYRDAFGSFGWFGFVKFFFVGAIMGRLYRYAICGFFFGQMLYVYTLNAAMHSITHGTHEILVSIWVYFFALGFPALYWARVKRARVQKQYV
jgi:hypothetical protein